MKTDIQDLKEGVRDARRALDSRSGTCLTSLFLVGKVYFSSFFLLDNVVNFQ